MRISTLPNDPGYVPGPYGKYEVYLDGALQTGKLSRRWIVTADDELGVIFFHEAGPGLRVKLDGSKFAMFELHGRVEIRLKEAGSACRC